MVGSQKSVGTGLAREGILPFTGKDAPGRQPNLRAKGSEGVRGCGRRGARKGGTGGVRGGGEGARAGGYCDRGKGVEKKIKWRGEISVLGSVRQR